MKFALYTAATRLICIDRRRFTPLIKMTANNFSSHHRLLESELPSKHAMKLFHYWYKEAEKRCPDHFSIFNLATVGSKDQKPRSRMLGLTGYDEHGFRFSTNDNSPKVQDIKQNANVCLNFFWPPLERSVRVNGLVTRFLKGDSDFDLCPGPESKLTLVAVEFQSQPVKNLGEILQMRETARQSPKGYDKCPPYWVTYEVEPEFVEFVQAQADFSSDRLRFFNPKFNQIRKFDPDVTHQGEDGWFYQRLTP